MDGGCGFGFLGNASVDPASQYTDKSLMLVSPSHAEHLRPVFASSETKGFLLAAQLQHYGVAQSTAIDHQAQQFAIKGDVTAVSEEQIENYICQFAQAAVLAQRIGANALQVHAANGYLLSSFLSPRTNRRRDRWGGTPLKRAEILFELLRRLRLQVGQEILIFVRLQIDDGLGEEGIQFHQLGEVSAGLKLAGADALTCATGVAETFSKFLGSPDHTLTVTRNAAHFLKSQSGLPVGFAANMDRLEMADRIIDSGDADFIGFGRALIADPYLVLKERNGMADAVVRCRWDSYCLRDKKEPSADRVYCCVNERFLRPAFIQKKYEELQ
nr:hypothetical protein [Rhizobium lemnae]